MQGKSPEIDVLTRGQSRSVRTRILWLQQPSPLGRTKEHRRLGRQKGAAPGRLPNTGCRTKWSEPGSDLKKGDNPTYMRKNIMAGF